MKNTNPFDILDKVKEHTILNEAYDKEMRKIQERRTMIWGWKNEQNKIRREKNKRKNSIVNRFAIEFFANAVFGFIIFSYTEE